MGTGGTAGAVQLIVLVLLSRDGWRPIEANGVAFLLAAQVNFLLSTTFTWGDRRPAGPLGRRWLLFHASIALMAAANMGVFIVARALVPLEAASLAGIAAGALGNYLLGDRLVFRDGNERDTLHEEPRSAA
jgi:putative flippase GtrA